MKVWDASGNVIWDTSDFIGRYIGSTQIGYGTGVITSSLFSNGIPWCIPLLDTSTQINANSNTEGHVNINAWMTCPSFYFSGNNLYWTRSQGSYPSYWPAQVCTLVYGVR
ncbi:hypothetical protein [Caballeronia sp. LZ019]|uniref:hypothetical protein n=1 Tax=Caballeronia sp. LZ019 TaxID=3038555 RepID=UPI002855D9FC|nr:hypothetical protein [Caballeronia sp. LZ019]MDR5811506.1 hypothetical protein [Caballeronia sp. LZ019]